MALADSTNPMQGVSGPGQFSKRTDLQYQSDSYGDGVAMDALKAGAPLDRSAPSPHATPTEVRQAAMRNPGSQAPNIGLYDATQRPDEPITHGVNVGPGAGASALAMQDSAAGQYQSAYQLFQQMAQSPNASPSLQYLAQRIQQGF